MSRLIITNGDAACAHLRAAGLDADLLPWRDVLHDGPIPAVASIEALSGIRAAFLASWGWGREVDIRRMFAERDALLRSFRRHDEVVLWFEHDLYDQLQLLQILAWFSRRPRGRTTLALVCREEFVTSIPRSHLPSELAGRRPIEDEALALAEAAWTAVSAPTPQSIRGLTDDDTTPLPFLRSALLRLLDELPDTRSGLARSERQILRAAAGGVSDPVGLFHATQQLEVPRYLGDASFFQYIARITDGPCPLLRTVDGRPFDPLTVDRRPGPATYLVVTDAGHRALEGRLDWVAANGVDRWLGGTRLAGHETWRWEEPAVVWR